MWIEVTGEGGQQGLEPIALSPFPFHFIAEKKVCLLAMQSSEEDALSYVQFGKYTSK